MAVAEWLAGLFGRHGSCTGRSGAASGAVSGAASDVASGADYVVIDTETSGLDAARDRLLTIGAVGVADGRIVPADSFHAVLGQHAPAVGDDILIHRVGTGEQSAGGDPAQVLDAFRHWCGTRWAVGFHAGFDRHMLERRLRELDRPPMQLAGWIDLAVLAPVLFPERAGIESLDDWLTSFGITGCDRHNALGDAFATAALLLPVLGRARMRAIASPAALAAESRAAAQLRAMRRR